MRLLKTIALAAIVVLAVFPVRAATPTEFYLDLLQKGIGHYNAAEYGQAASTLRVAAFGLLDATDRYEIAQVYRALSADKVSDAATTRDAARRVLAAERIQRSYALLPLPAAVRSAFEGVARKVLAPGEVSELKSAAPPPPTPVQTTQPAETRPAQVQTQPVAQSPSRPAPAPAPPPGDRETGKPAETKKPAPAQTQQPVTQSPSRPVPTPAPPPGDRETGKPAEAKKPAPAKPAPAKPAPAPTPAPPRDLISQFTAAESALAKANLAEARRIYRQLLDATLTHEQAMRAAEGLYRARDFAGVVRAFERAGALRKGEEPYRFYLAVAYYETGRFAAAKKELDATLPYIEVTADVARYRDKIAAAPNK